MKFMCTMEIANTMPEGLDFDTHGRISKHSLAEYKSRPSVQRLLNDIENNFFSELVPKGGTVSILRAHDAMDGFFIRAENDGEQDTEKG